MLLCLLTALAMHAEAATAVSEWEAPAECPDRSALQRAITRRLGRALADGEVELSGRISRGAGTPRYRLALRLVVGARAQLRTLSASRCASLVDASALLVALAVADAQVEGDAGAAVVPGAGGDSSAAPEAVEGDASVAGSDDLARPVVAVREAPGRVERPAIDGARADDRADVDAAPEGTSRGPGGLMRVFGGPEYGAVPGVTGGVGLAGGLLWRRARLEVQGLYLAPRTATRGASSARVSVLAGSLHGCYRVGLAALELPLCAGLELGAQRARVEGPGARSTAGLWIAAVASLGVAWRVHARVSLTLALQGVVPVVRPRYELAGPGPTVTLFRALAGAGRLLLGLEMRFGDRS